MNALFKDVGISKYIKLTRLRWAGHVIRREDQETSRLLAQPLGSMKAKTALEG